MTTPERKEHARPPAEDSVTGAEPTVQRGRRRPILIVDAEPAVGAPIVRALRARGHDARAVGSGREALLAVHGAGPVPAVIVTETDMPGMSGIELAARVAADRPSVAVILMSESPAVLDTARDRPELIRGVLAKPVVAAEVVRAVETLVGSPGGGQEHGDD